MAVKIFKEGHTLDPSMIDGLDDYILNLIGQKPSAPIGSGCLWFGTLTTIPPTYLPMDGRGLSKTDYSDLFNIIGYTYGGSDGTFNLPNVAGRVIIHPDGSTEFDSTGGTGGSKTTTLSVANLPSHKHTVNAHTHNIPSHLHSTPNHSHTYNGTVSTNGNHTHQVYLNNDPNFPVVGYPGWATSTASVQRILMNQSNGTGFYFYAGAAGNHNHTFSGTTSSNNGGNTGVWSGSTASAGSGNTSSVGNGQSFSNLQPYIVAYYIIKVKN